MGKPRPNLVLFNPDQWRGDVLGHVGNPAAQTPVLDQLVETEAVSFTRTFCQNPVCVPSRCSFMTGLYPHNRGHRTMYHMLHPERGEQHLLQQLRKNGYMTWWAGKNDLFDRTLSENGSTEVDVRAWATEDDYRRWGGRPYPNSHVDQSWRNAPGSEGFYSMFHGKLEPRAGERFLDSDWGSVLKACEFIREYESEQPFCLFLSLSYPHPPYAVEEPYFSAIDREALPERIHPPEHWKGKPEILQTIHERQGLGQWGEPHWEELRATYYGSCMRLDHQLGLLMDALKSTGAYDETALFLFSDHGDFTGDYDLVEKNQNTFEDCLTRVPLIVKPPAGIEVCPGVRDATLVELVDLPATVYELAGVEPDYDHFGKSLIPAFTSDQQDHRPAVFCEGGRRKGEVQASESSEQDAHDPNGMYWPRVGIQISESPFYHNYAVMCRTSRWKYVYRSGEEDELYDLDQDPHESHNRIQDPDCASILHDLRGKLFTWSLETVDPVPRSLDQR